MFTGQRTTGRTFLIGGLLAGGILRAESPWIGSGQVVWASASQNYGQPRIAKAVGGPSYRAEIERWRRETEENLYSDLRLLVVDRFELHEGKFSIGSAATNDLVVPVGPASLGTLALRGKTVEVVVRSGLSGTYNNQPTTKATLALTEGFVPNPLWIGSVGLAAREWNGKIRLSVLDRQAEVVRTRKPLRWFPVRRKYKIAAKFVPFKEATTLSLPDSEGGQRRYPSPGLVSFSIDGRQHTLQAIQPGKQLWFVFRDKTSGKQTYGAGRFLYADPPKNGIVIMDFNKAVNPLCAVNAFIACPLAPKQNRLLVPISAGQLNYSPE